MRDVAAGGIVLLPRDQAHTFQNTGSTAGRLLTVVVPAGFERFFEAIVDQGIADDQQIEAVAAEFGLEILGPVPGSAD